MSVSLRKTQGGHQFDSSIRQLAEKETEATICSLRVVSRDERIKKPSNKDAKPVTSNGNFAQLFIEDNSRRNAIANARPEGT